MTGLSKKRSGTFWPAIEKNWRTYKKKTKGMEQMTKPQWLKFNYPKQFKAGKPGAKTLRTKDVEHRLKHAGVTPAEIRRLRGK